VTPEPAESGPQQWELTRLRRERVPAGYGPIDMPGGRWLLVSDGTAALTTASGTIPLAAGDAALIDGRTPHEIVALEDAEIASADLRLVVAARTPPSPLVVSGFSAQHPGVAALVARCPLGYGACRQALFVMSYANLIGVAMMASWLEDEAGDAAADGADAVVADLVAALVAEPAEAWTLARMAKVVHLSRSALTERVRRATGRSPMQLLRDIRMQEARMRLGKLAEPVGRVAFAIGYGSVAAFSRAFSAYHGMSPQHWVESWGRDADEREPHARDNGGHRADEERHAHTMGVQ